MTRIRYERLVFWSVAAVLLVIASLLHFWKIGSAPAGFYIDESSNAYNAYCIAQTGADEYGTKWPMFFRCFDDYHDPVMIYLLVPCVKLFGLKQGVARFPSALFLVLAGIGFAFLVQQHCRSKWLSLLSGFWFSLLPWVFVVSRIITGGYTAMLLGMILGWLMILLALEKESYGYAVGAGVAWAFAMYAHNIGRPMTVLILICFAMAYAPAIRTRWKVGLVFGVSWLGMLIPMAVSVARAPVSLTSRFEKIGIVHDQPVWSEILGRFASRYAEYFSPQFLFVQGDTNLRHHSGFGGELFLFLIPMIAAGIYCLVRFSSSQPSHRFIGLGLLVYPVAAALTLDRMHSGRSINGVIFWALTAAIGARFLWQNRPVGRSVLLVTCCAGLVESGLYLKDYFGWYQLRSRNEFHAPFTETLEDCFQTLGQDEILYLSVTAFAPLKLTVDRNFKPFYYTDILFFGKIDPRVYQQRGIPASKVCPYEGVIDKPGLLLRCNVHLEEPAIAGLPPAYAASQETIPAGAKLLRTVPLGGSTRYEVYRVK